MKQKPSANGKHYWRSLDERANTPQFRKWVEQEFPQSANEMDNAWSRRSFLTLMAASMAMAGLAGCRRPVEKIVPYSKDTESVTPGLPNFFATTMPRGNSAYGAIVQSHEGRPTKIEGNELHPSTRGKSSLEMQAAILDLYDPDRSQHPLHDNQPATWDDFIAAWSELSTDLIGDGGARLAVLSEPYSSPTMARLKKQFQARFPQATWVGWEPVSDENIYAGFELAGGSRYQPVYNYDQAQVILSLDADFLLTESDSVTAAAGFAAGRHLDTEQDSMNRLYVVESLFSVTGASADHRLALKPDLIPVFATAVAAALRDNGVPVDGQITMDSTELPAACRAWVAPLAADLAQAGPRSLVVAGRRQPQAVHALAMYLNDLLGSVGNTVSYLEPNDAVQSSSDGLKTLIDRMKGGSVSTLVMLGGNPVYNAPVDLAFGEALKKVATSIHLSSHRDETSRETTWHIPRAHFLESFGDTRAADGTVGMVQPLIEPLFGGKPDIEFVSALNSEKNNKGYDLVRQTWQQEWGGGFDDQWSQALHDGIVADTGYAIADPQVAPGLIAEALAASGKGSGSDELQFVFHADNTLNDGTGANNGWLQELPDPITKLSWDNVATVSPATARRLGVKNEDMVDLTHAGRSMSMPIWIVPGQADDVVGLALGYGRTESGRVGNGVGFNTYTLRTM
ncbi:MAG: TAT-variant-translocated molybdopterin oxidoreductase [candidate division Zixibacteria bacterium]|nr:TAT-variant-translocated molybdopterin oxidoreductase [candidate division Zixibacteria bacterium]